MSELVIIGAVEALIILDGGQTPKPRAGRQAVVTPTGASHPLVTKELLKTEKDDELPVPKMWSHYSTGHLNLNQSPNKL